jgi:hypothetical protein
MPYWTVSVYMAGRADVVANLQRMSGLPERSLPSPLGQGFSPASVVDRVAAIHERDDFTPGCATGAATTTPLGRRGIRLPPSACRLATIAGEQ